MIVTGTLVCVCKPVNERNNFILGFSETISSDSQPPHSTPSSDKAQLGFARPNGPRRKSRPEKQKKVSFQQKYGIGTTQQRGAEVNGANPWCYFHYFSQKKVVIFFLPHNFGRVTRHI